MGSFYSGSRAIFESYGKTLGYCRTSRLWKILCYQNTQRLIQRYHWCLDRWNIRRDTKTTAPIKNGWHRLVARQVPIESPRYKRQLLTIDLIGISEDGFPMVVEMKGNTKQAAVLALILQALDYAIRLKKCWPYFFPAWQEILSKYKWPLIQKSPQRIHLVCAAPDEVWQHEQKPRFVPNLIFYTKLRQSLELAGFPVSLVSLRTRTLDKANFEVMAEPFDFIGALDRKAVPALLNGTIAKGVQRIEDIAVGRVKGLTEDEFRSRLAREKRR
jgi:hypothetical protein